MRNRLYQAYIHGRGTGGPELLKHLWERKKIGKTYTRCWTLGWGIAEVSLPLWKRTNTKSETGGKIVFLCWLITFIIQITWNTILCDFHVTPAINYGKLLVLFFFKTLPEPTSFSFFFWFTRDDRLRENNSTSSPDESLLRISCNFSSCTF